MPGVCVKPTFAVCALLPAEECYVLLSSFSFIPGADQGSRETIILQTKHKPARWIQHFETAASGGPTHYHNSKHFLTWASVARKGFNACYVRRSDTDLKKIILKGWLEGDYWLSPSSLLFY